LLIEHVMQLLQRAVISPKIEIARDRAFRGQIFRDRAPLTASRENVHEAVYHLPHDHRALTTTSLARRDQRFDQSPFVVGQIARIPQLAAVVTGAVFPRPHGDPSSNQATTLESQMIHMIQELFGQTLRITDRGAISFHVMRRLPGKPHPVRVVLGRYPSLSLAAARKQAGAALADLAAGIHPRERARALQTAGAQRKAVPLGHVVEEFASRHLSRKRTGHGVGQLLRRELVSRWGNRPITDINRADVIGMIEAIGDRSPSVARRTWVYTRRLFGWALSRDVYGLTASPCERIRIADLIGSPRPRERVLSADE